MAPITLFLAGDVMTGRGIDQILPHPVAPAIHERWVRDARDYVELAERRHGKIPRPVGFAYVWGGAASEWRRVATHRRLINLETAVTTSEACWVGKAIHYRMHPANLPVLPAAGIDCCSLANNHSLDWGYAGLVETLESLGRAGIRFVGAGRDRDEARCPAVFDLPTGGRLLVFGVGFSSSGIPPEWAAGADRPGVFLLSESGERVAAELSEWLWRFRRPGDVIVLSVHWGANWGYRVPTADLDFAHALVDRGAIDILHGHSSHHPKGIEVYRDRLILYGCGDFLSDYEGIHGHEQFRGDLSLMVFASVEPFGGRLTGLRLVPMRTRRFQLNRAPAEDALWICETLNRLGKNLGTAFALNEAGEIELGLIRA